MRGELMTVANYDIYVLITETDEERARGLLDYRLLPEGLGMLITGVTAIHTRGMRFPIDVAWLDANAEIITWETVSPEREMACPYPCSGALELPAGFFERHPL
jgi:uncharacterized membrane protein (UPF0127 family)